VIAGLERMRPVTRRKAILLNSSGIDTFSKASLDDASKARSTSETPIYAIDLGASLREAGGMKRRSAWPLR
jgi:hypothetical protein